MDDSDEGRTVMDKIRSLRPHKRDRKDPEPKVEPILVLLEAMNILVDNVTEVNMRLAKLSVDARVSQETVLSAQGDIDTVIRDIKKMKTTVEDMKYQPKSSDSLRELLKF